MPEYELWTAELAVCTLCGAVVRFNSMSVHTRWHEGRWAEPVDPPAEDPE